MRNLVVLVTLSLLATACSSFDALSDPIEGRELIEPESRSSKKTWVVWCAPALLEIDEPPHVPKGNEAIEVKYDDLYALVNFLETQLEKKIEAPGPLSAYAYFMEKTLTDDQGRPETAWDLTPAAGGDPIRFTPVGHNSIPIGGLWLRRPGPQYLHVIEQASSKPPLSGGEDYPNRKIAYAKKNGKYWNVYAPLYGYERVGLPPAM